jgi:hypothetical protein
VRVAAVAVVATLLIAACGDGGGDKQATGVDPSSSGRISPTPTGDGRGQTQTPTTGGPSGSPTSTSTGSTWSRPPSSTGGPTSGTTRTTQPPHVCGTPPSGLQDGRLRQAVVFKEFPAYWWPRAAVTLTACATSGLPVKYTFAEQLGCTLTGTRLSMPRPGWCTITASQRGDPKYAPAAPVTRKFEVNPQVVTLSWVNPPKSLTVGQEAKFTLKVGSPNGPVRDGAYIVLHAGASEDDVCWGLLHYNLNKDNPPVLSVAVNREGSCNVGATMTADQFIRGAEAPRLTVPIAAAAS